MASALSRIWDPWSPRLTAPPAIPPNRVSGTGQGERHFVGDPGFVIPQGLSALQALGALGSISAWTGDTFVTLGDGSTAWWNGTAWVAGKPGTPASPAPAPPPDPIVTERSAPRRTSLAKKASSAKP
jgi:hypothetical protein